MPAIFAYDFMIRALLAGLLIGVLAPALGTFLVLTYVGLEDVGMVGASLLVILGLSFIIGGILGNPGCELTALPNLLLPRSRRMHFT